MARVHIATKKVFALMFSVWCVRVVPSSRAQCTKKSASSRAQCVFLRFFFSRMQDHGLSEKQTKKERPTPSKNSLSQVPSPVRALWFIRSISKSEAFYN